MILLSGSNKNTNTNTNSNTTLLSFLNNTTTLNETITEIDSYDFKSIKDMLSSYMGLFDHLLFIISSHKFIIFLKLAYLVKMPKSWHNMFRFKNEFRLSSNELSQLNGTNEQTSDRAKGGDDSNNVGVLVTLDE